MKVINLTERGKLYTANVFFVHGSWNALDDVNTLVDVGRDPAVIKRINEAPSGVGKKKVDQVILTHSHYDHASLLPLIRELFSPVVYAFSPYLKGVDHLLKDGENLKIGDKIFEVIFTPVHSSDSLCLYCEEEGVIFTGDTPMAINSCDGIYDESFVVMLRKICARDIQKIYPGHGNPVTRGVKEMICASLRNIETVRPHSYFR
jgi:glyoxylase-like metal-dependent hydrolase (beta-lactamase superfamily II)